MIAFDARDPMRQNLARLRRLSPDPAHAARVRAKCRARLRRTRRSKRTAVAGFARCIVAPAVVGWFCVVYIADLVGVALRLHSALD